MPVQTLEITSRDSKSASWTATGGGLVAVLSDSDDATYARSNTPRVRTIFGCGDPVSPTGELVSVCPVLRTKKTGTMRAEACVCTSYEGDLKNTGVVLRIPTETSATDHELPAHKGCQDRKSVV
jgi:hypothetical protein